MGRPTTVIGLLGLAIIGMIAADVLIHPDGTNAAGNAIVKIVTPTEQALLGTPPK